MVFTTRSKAVKETKLAYLGMVGSSAKIEKNQKKNVDTFVLYLAPASKSGYNVCPMATGGDGITVGCIDACLDESGRNGVMSIKNQTIDNARIKKTKMFFEDRAFFMAWLVAEITAHKAKSEKNGHEFSVRINGTSDLSLEIFKHGDKTILELFPDTQFYDYTKVLNRVKVVKVVNKYKNYDITFSYSGNNWLECESALAQGVRLAVVFEKRLPKKYMGIKVVNADETDLRYLEPNNIICGLIHKKTRKKIIYGEQSFIIADTDTNCVYE